MFDYKVIKTCNNPKVLVTEYAGNDRYLYFFEDVIDAERYEMSYIDGLTQYYKLEVMG